jgi:hypothetical protein
MISGNPDVRGLVLDHFQYSVQYAHDCARWLVFALVKASQAIKLPEKLVRAVDEMDEHEVNN